MSMALLSALNLLVRSVPCHLLAYYPYRDRLRFPACRTALILASVMLIHAVLYGAAASSGSGKEWAEYVSAPVYMALFFLFVRADRARLLYLYLFVADYTMVLRALPLFLAARCTGGPLLACVYDTALSCVLSAAALPFMLRVFARAKERAFQIDAPSFWRTAWTVPACITVLAFIGSCGRELAGSLRFLFIRALLLPCMLAVYSASLRSLDAVRRQAALAEHSAMQEHLLAVQKTQYGQLLKHIQETKAARHDLRQHLSIIRSYADSGENEKLLQYLDAYEHALPADTHKTFCQNFALNAALTYYAEQARRHQIALDVDVSFPERLPVSEPEACALLGNLLENAVEACQGLAGAPYIRVRGQCEGSRAVLTVDNTCASPPRQENGRFLSSKHAGYGTGTYSVRMAAERCGGEADFAFHDGMFYASVLLYGDKVDDGCMLEEQ